MRNDSPRVTRRGVQITLGLLWLGDGALKFQPAMLTSAFARQVIAPAGQGQPGFISWPVHEAASIIAHSPAAADIIFGLIELALGAGLLYRRTARWALAASVGWALSVWYLGEGLGGLFGGGASLLTGAPGSALMYAVVAVTVWPRRDGSPAGQRPARWAAAAWAAVWLGGALLQLLPGSDTNASLSMALSMNASGAPGWLAGLDNHLAALGALRRRLARPRPGGPAGRHRPRGAGGPPHQAGGRPRRYRPVAGLLGDGSGPRRALVGHQHRSGDGAAADTAGRDGSRRGPLAVGGPPGRRPGPEPASTASPLTVTVPASRIAAAQ